MSILYFILTYVFGIMSYPEETLLPHILNFINSLTSQVNTFLYTYPLLFNLQSKNLKQKF